MVLLVVGVGAARPGAGGHENGGEDEKATHGPFSPTAKRDCNARCQHKRRRGRDPGFSGQPLRPSLRGGEGLGVRGSLGEGRVVVFTATGAVFYKGADRAGKWAGATGFPQPA